ncbi:uncharacterized protein LOC126552844 isoform X1 [Aphis gossypii]|uniref:uncharacterized protein LOC114130167 isoform X1 n=1 Tax=Aphis gossypii TaxID=80765 RepID=UPI002158BCC9|nr:uncharacterized protein LOC114130167 isoform X1 [Aphis gossypii]XP_050063840.1 uncharacterized protein LOC126552844 isoform X1 [Aphis gossypii]
MSTFVVLVITVIISIGAGADLQTDKDMLEVTPQIQDGCPPLESAEYQVTVMSSISLVINGCAYINYNSSNVMRQSYSLWFDRVQHGGQCSRDQAHNLGMEHLSFYCLKKSPVLPENTNKGRMYLRLYDETSNKTGKPYQKCAMYETVNGDATTFKIAISGHTSCDGLLHMLSPSLLQMIPQFNKGSVLLLFNKTKLDVLTTPPLVDMTTTESIESIAKRYERRGYILQNFGNRPNPFRKTRRSVVQDSNKSTKVMHLFNKTKLDVLTTPPLVDMTTTESIESIAKRYERRGYILQNFGNRPNPFRKTRRSVVQDSNKSTEMAATMDKNKSRPLSMEFMQRLLQIQLRHKRSLNTTINSYSDITGYSWIQG